jgi:HEPN domain-containing protein
VTNAERADRLFAEARLVGAEMRGTLDAGGWNLAARRAQEVLELVIKALLNEMGVEYPRTHDPAPVLASTVRARGLEVDAPFLEWLSGLSAELEKIRSPAFYQEIVVTETQARTAVQGAERALDFGRSLLERLRRA